MKNKTPDKISPAPLIPKKEIKPLKASTNEAILEKNNLPENKKQRGLIFKLQKRKKDLASQEKIKAKEMEKELKIIYQEEGKMPAMDKLEFKNKNKTRNLILGIIIVLLIILTVSFLGLLVFQPQSKFTGNKVNLEIKAPFSAVSGENITYQIKYANLEDVSLTKLQLIVNLPNGFIFASSNLPPQIPAEQLTYSNIKTWQINDLYPNQNQTLEITGKLIGAINSKQTISATLSYVPANFNSEFQKNVAFSTDFNESLVNLEVEHDNQVATKEETELTLKITNKSPDVELNNLSIELAYPAEFTLLESQIIEPESQSNAEAIKPAKEETSTGLAEARPGLAEASPGLAEASPKVWLIDSLLPQAQKQIKIKGKFEVQESAPIELTATAKLKGPADDYFSQKEEKISLEVIKGELLTNLIINGSNQNKPVNFGDSLNYLISIQNKSKKALGDIKIRAVLDSIFLDWPSLKDENKGLHEEEQILWTKDQISRLALLLPEEEVEINFTINLKTNPTKKYKADDYKVKSFFEAQINKMDNKDAQIVNQSPTLINELNTDLNLNVIGRYFDDKSNTVGSGPLPPIVGQKTTYRIFWTLTNSLHEINNIEVKTKLPDYVTFENNQNISTGNLFKNQQNEIVWQISRIPTSVAKSTAEFDIAITPKPADAHKILTLLADTIVTALDAQTNGQINLTVSGLTTNLDTDPLGKNKGLIQEE